MVLENVKRKILTIQEDAEQKLERDQDLTTCLAGGKKPTCRSGLQGIEKSLQRRERLLLTTRRALNRLGVKDK
jgi:hypothetical protein